MTLYFAYGANLSRAGMAARCPGARAVGPAALEGYAFFVGIDGWGSVRRAPGAAQTTVQAINPAIMVELSHAPEIKDVAADADARLRAALTTLLPPV